MSKFIHFTENEIYRAAHVNIKDFLESKGEKVLRSGTEYMWERHDSVKFRDHVWYRHSTGDKGTVINFLCTFYNMSFQDAVITLLNYSKDDVSVRRLEDKSKSREKKKFCLPQKYENNDRLFDYLCGFRCIDKDVVSYFVDNNYIYESRIKYKGRDIYNCVFVGYDNKHKARYAALKGTNSYYPYTGEVEDSEKSYGFNYIGGSEILYAFEAAIDLLSYISLFRLNEPWKKDNYVALGTLSRLALDRVLIDYPNIRKIYLCLDNDSTSKKNRGQIAAQKFMGIYKEKGYSVETLVPTLKDWNEDLKEKRNAR